MLRFVVAAIVLSGAAAACKGGGESDSNLRVPVTDDEFRWMAAQAVNAALLNENDLPASFDLVPAEVDEDDDDEPAVLLTDECAEFNDIVNLETNFIAAVAEAETGDFENADEDSFSSNAGAFRDASAAEAEASVYQRFWDSPVCIDQFREAARSFGESLLAEEGVTLTTWRYDVEAIAVPAEGDWAIGVRASIAFAASDGRGVDFIVDTVSVREGRMIGSVVYTYAEDPDVALRDAVVETIAARLAEQDANLPG